MLDGVNHHVELSDLQREADLFIVSHAGRVLDAPLQRDLEDVNETIRKEMKFIFVDDVKGVFKAALLGNKPAKAVRGPRRLRKGAEAVV